MKINEVANAREHGGNDERLGIGTSKTDVAGEGFIENFVDSDSVVECPDWFTNNASALAGGKNV